MSEETKGTVGAMGSRHEGEYGILIEEDDEWYNGDGDAPGNISKGDTVEIEYHLTEGDDGVDRIIDDIEKTGSGSSGSSGSGTKGTKDDRAVSRQSAAKSVASMFQGNPPEDAEDMLRRYKYMDQIAHFNIKGEWPDSVQNGQMVFEESVPDDVEEKLEELSDRLGQIEEAGGPEAASVEDFNEVHEDVQDLEKKVSQLETLMENVQEGMKNLKEEVQDEDELFPEEDEEGENDDKE